MTNKDENQKQMADAGTEVGSSSIIVYDEAGKDHMSVENLKVRLPGKTEPLIDNVNLKLNRGDRLLVTGESGSGKTTLVKAMLSLWNHGEGIVSLPEGQRVMMIPQQVYLPNLPLRSILNMTAEGDERYEDRDLRAALEAVNLGKLVQYIPGQQVEILMDDLLAFIDENINDDDFDAFDTDLSTQIVKLVEEQFDVVQFVRPEERAYFKAGLQKTLEAKGKTFNADTQKWADSVVNRIDLQLVSPLRKGLENFAPIFADQVKKNSALGYGKARAHHIANALRDDLYERMENYIRNRDTEDPYRVVRLNDYQARHVVKAFTAGVETALQKPLDKHPLRQAFNVASLPFRGVGMFFKYAVGVPWRVATRSVSFSYGLTKHFTNRALGRTDEPMPRFMDGWPTVSPVKGRAMKDLMFNIAAFMEAQIMRGDRLATRLSGGQQKMLMAASVLLAKPDILMLDEIPSGLDSKSGLKVYENIMNAIPKDSTVISIIHHEDQFVKFHNKHARVENKGVTLIDLNKEEPKGNKPKPGNPAP